MSVESINEISLYVAKMRTQFVQREIGLRLRVKVDILSIKLDVDHIVDDDTGPVTARQMDCLLIV